MSCFALLQVDDTLIDLSGYLLSSRRTSQVQFSGQARAQGDPVAGEDFSAIISRIV
jgi:hypothetical protein